MSSLIPLPYLQRDFRRILCVLGAIDTLDHPSIYEISKVTKLARKSVSTAIDLARTQAGVDIQKDGVLYRIVDWGPAINRAGAILALHGALGAHTMPKKLRGVSNV